MSDKDALVPAEVNATYNQIVGWRICPVCGARKTVWAYSCVHVDDKCEHILDNARWRVEMVFISRLVFKANREAVQPQSENLPGPGREI